MERRHFISECSAICATGIGLAFLMDGCGSIHYVSSSVESNKIALHKTEFIYKKNTERKFVVVRSDKIPFPICLYKKSDEYIAVYMQCTHQGCELHPNKISLVCPCHGSEFSPEGKVQSPPADKDLKRFKVTTVNETIYIEL